VGTNFVALRHERFRAAQRDIFIRHVVADCMSHTCRLVHERSRRKLDACCQYGVDVDIAERDAILERGSEIVALLRKDVAGKRWFGEDETRDDDFPSGRYVRTTTHDGGCIFLAHDRRGCAIHRASVEGAWDYHGVKPHVCRLFPLSYDERAILLSDDYPDYSCSRDRSAPTVYRVGRDAVGAIFGTALVDALDEAEALVLDEPLTALRVIV
jgi:hypothetical protein